MGSLFAARFALAGLPVTLFGRPAPHLCQIQRHGLWLEELDSSRHLLPLAVATDPGAAAATELALVMVKTWATTAALLPLRDTLPAAAIVLTLQNGLGNQESIQQVLPGHEVIVGVTSQGAVRPDPGTVQHTGAGPTVVGWPAGAVDERVIRIAGQLKMAGISTAAVADIDRWVWRKLAVNAAINGPTALAGVPNGAIATDSRLRAAADILAGEVAAVAYARGLPLDRVEELVAEIARATATNRSSMWQDLAAGRPTEVAAIYDAVIAAGGQAGIDTPANRVLSALIHAREDHDQDEMKEHA
jgi:2-dehydropantoate 2-reductase